MGLGFQALTGQTELGLATFAVCLRCLSVNVVGILNPDVQMEQG